MKKGIALLLFLVAYGAHSQTRLTGADVKMTYDRETQQFQVKEKLFLVRLRPVKYLPSRRF